MRPINLALTGLVLVSSSSPLLMTSFAATEKSYPLPSPLVCPSSGVATIGYTDPPSSSRASSSNLDLYEESSQEADMLEFSASFNGRKCEADCTLIFYPGYDPALPPEKRDNAHPNRLRWRIMYACVKPPPKIINQTMAPAGGGSTQGGGATPAGQDRSQMPLDFSTVTTNCVPCQNIVDELKEVADDEAKAERQARDINAQIEAARSRGDNAEADALVPQSAQLSNQIASDRTWLKHLWEKLKDCEKKKFPAETGNSLLPHIEIGIGAGGGTRSHRPGSEQPQQPQPQPQGH